VVCDLYVGCPIERVFTLPLGALYAYDGFGVLELYEVDARSCPVTVLHDFRFGDLPIASLVVRASVVCV
jgi:hypothetical protein